MSVTSEIPPNKVICGTCKAKMDKGWMHTFCVRHSLCYLDEKFYPERCPDCTSLIKTVLKDPSTRNFWSTRITRMKTLRASKLSKLQQVDTDPLGIFVSEADKLKYLKPWIPRFDVY